MQSVQIFLSAEEITFLRIHSGQQRHRDGSEQGSHLFLNLSRDSRYAATGYCWHFNATEVLLKFPKNQSTSAPTAFLTAHTEGSLGQCDYGL